MINQAIIEHLSQITDEERSILDGTIDIDRSIYSNKGDNVINAKKLLETGKLISIRPHTRFVHFPEHTHDFVEAVYMCSGSTEHIINGEHIKLNQGELLFLGQNARQEICKAGKDDIAVNFIILPEFFDQPLRMIGEEDTPIKQFIINCLGEGDNFGYLHFKVTDLSPVQNLIENLLWTLINGEKYKQSINKTTMGLLFMHLLNNTDRLDWGSKEDATIMQVMRYIEDNYSFGTLTEISELLHCDIYWLSREIKNKTGKTYTEIVQQKRLTQAAYLLKHTAMSVADISQSVGYDNTSYFHKLFVQRYCTTPKKYRSCK